MKKSKIVSILALVLVFSLTSCDIGRANSNNSSKESETTSSSSEEAATKTYPFSHSWRAADFGDSVSNQKLSAGSTTIDDLTWSYTEVSTYFSDDANNGKGLQIGSSNNPQTAGWTLSTDFGEDVTLTSFSMILSVGSGGSATYDLKVDGSSVWTDTFSDSTAGGITYSNTTLNEDCSSLSLTLTASSKAMYIDTMSFTLTVDADSKYEGELNGNEDESIEDRDPVTPGKNGVPQTKYTINTNTVTSYYSTIDDIETGTQLEQDLHELISQMTKYSYGDCRYMLLYTDEAVDYPGYVYGAYDGDLLPAVWDSGTTWNREHTWPRARMGGENADNNIISRTSDLHNIRATCVQANSKRGDGYFDMTTGSSTFYPNYSEGALAGSGHRYKGDFRGDVARICFYMYVRYGRYDEEITLNLSSDINDMNDLTMGNLSTLLEWNIDDPVDAFETQRNNRIYEYQGNRNPFIDHPEYAERLFN